MWPENCFISPVSLSRRKIPCHHSGYVQMGRRNFEPSNMLKMHPKRSVQVICIKIREDDKIIVRLKEGNPGGCHVTIDDDFI